MKDVGADLGGVVVPVAVDLPTNARQFAPVLPNPLNYPVVRLSQPLVWTPMYGGRRFTSRNLTTLNFSDVGKLRRDLDTAFNIHSLLASIAIDRNIVSCLCNLAGTNGSINDVVVATYLARQLSKRGSATYCGDKGWLEFHDGYFTHDCFSRTSPYDRLLHHAILWC